MSRGQTVLRCLTPCVLEIATLLGLHPLSKCHLTDAAIRDHLLHGEWQWAAEVRACGQRLGYTRIMTQPCYCRPAAYEAFRSELSRLDTCGGLFRAAFAISLHECPEGRLAEAEAIVDQLSMTIQARLRSDSLDARLAHLHDVLFDVLQLRGNTQDYYHPSNSYMLNVLKTRRGLPISLVLIYKRVAEPLEITVHGINSPGHFLAELELADSKPSLRMFVDPFFGGGLLTPEEALQRIAQATGSPVRPGDQLFRRATPHAWLTRMLTNLQAAFSASGQQRNQLAMQELQQLLDATAGS